MNAVTKRILLYVGLTFALTFGFVLLAVKPLLESENPMLATIGQAGISLVMLLPALCVALTRALTREGFADAWLKPVEFKKRWGYYALAWFGPAALTLVGCAVYFLAVPGDFDPGMGYIRASYEALGATLTAEEAKAALGQQLITALLAGPLLNCVTCFGEEWGWRGYLLPKLITRMPIWGALLLSGVIWGLWHAPLTLLGHNYGLDYPGYPYAGIAAMCVFCIANGVFFSFVTLRAGSCIPAVLAHGGLNSIAQAGLYYTRTGGNPFVGPMPTGILGGSAILLAALVFGALLLRDARRPRPIGALPGENEPASAESAAKAGGG